MELRKKKGRGRRDPEKERAYLYEVSKIPAVLLNY